MREWWDTLGVYTSVMVLLLNALLFFAFKTREDHW